MPIYQAAGTEYGVQWEYLAAINEIETNYGRNLNVSTAGAQGWMQFMPATWKQYGVDANKDGRKDPYNPVDAIFAAARYLKAAGAPKNMRKAIFAYNHAGWYVDSVVLRTRLIAGMSPNLVGSLTGLAEARFPVRGRVKYADDISARQARKRVKPGQNAANTVAGDPNRKNIELFAKKGSPVIAVNDGVVMKIGRSKRLGRYIVLKDNFGNRFTYANLGSISEQYPVPKEDVRKQAEREARRSVAALTVDDPRPDKAASAGRQDGGGRGSAGGGGLASALGGAKPSPGGEQPSGGSRYQAPVVKERLFAHPNRRNALAAGGAEQLAAYGADPLAPGTPATPGSLEGYFLNTRGFDSKDFRLAPLRKGARIMGDTIVGRVGDDEGGKDPRLSFAIRPAGEGAPEIDPKPLLDGWKLLEATAIYRASGKNVLQGGASVGQILLMPKNLLQKRVLGDDRIEIYSCGRKDVARGQVSRQVLASMAYLAEVGLKPTVSSLRCGHSYYTTSGNVSAHSSGDALDISRWNGQPVLGNQQKGGPTYQAIKRMMLLQGTMKPQQLISLFDIGGPTLKMADHADHLHIGFRRAGGRGKPGVGSPVLKRDDWYKLVKRLGDIDNPAVSRRPSKSSLPARRGGGRSHGE
ncbi:MAG: lytic murein transglycosylase [Thermoleophilaceae bacterium]|nr:lytic murein transglycosylase [Thermoleophilaceae bacterium]